MKKIFFCFTFLMCIFSLKIVAQLPCSNPTNLANITNYCSNNAEYTNVPVLSGTTTLPACWTSNPTQDVWFSFTATQTDVLISVNGNGSGGGTMNNPCIALYVGPCTASLSEIGCSNGTSGTTQLYKGGLSPGTVYLIRISTTAANKGTFKLCVNNYTPTLNPGADCGGAAYICNKNPISVSGLSGGGSNNHEPELTTCAGGTLETNSCWYTFTCQTSGTLTFDLIPSNISNDIDYILYKLSGTNVCGTRTPIRCNFSSCINSNGSTGLNPTSTDSSVVGGCNGIQNSYCKQVNLVAGVSYALFINNFSTSSGFTINWGGTSTFLGPTPRIVATDTTICAGQTVTFNGSTSTNWTNLNWNFSSGGNPVSATGAGPHTITYNTPGSYVAILEGVSTGGCKTVTSIHVIVSPSPSVTITPPATLTCSATSISLTATATPLPVSYLWSGPGILSGGTTATATVNSPGTYIVTVTNPGGCSTSASVVVTQQGTPTATASKTDVSCNGGSNGTASVTVTGGTTPYTYVWAPSGGAGTTASNLVAGTYTVTVTDNLGCSAKASVTINQPPVLTVTASETDVSCNGGNNGTATVTATGGTAPYAYSWSPSGGAGAIASSLAAGTYSVTVTDKNGCSKISSVVITEPSAITLTTSTTPANCGLSDGSASVTSSGGTPAYTYSWSPGGATTATISSIAGGVYSVIVTDFKGCTKTVSVTVANTNSATVTATGNNVSCNGGSDGTATSTVTGGSPPYTYSWNSVPIQTTQNVTGLSAGTYVVTVKDNIGCACNATVVISEPPVIVLATSTTPANCGGSDGSANVTASGGTAGYSYSWNTVPVQSTATASGLSANSYIVTVTDSKGCTQTAAVNIANIGSPTVATTKSDVSCNGTADGSINTTVTGGVAPYTYQWSNSATTLNISGLSAGIYTLTVTGANNCTASVTDTIVEPPLLVLTTSTIDANCGAADGSAKVIVTGGVSPYLCSWTTSPVQTGATANNLMAGTYTVTVFDAHGCSQAAVVTINNIAGPVLTTSVTNVGCNGGNNGTATVTVTGGVSPYSYLWNTSPAQATATATNLKAGTYIITVTAANGCQAFATVTITEPTAIILTGTSTNENCGKGNGTVSAFVSGGTPPYSYLWSSNPVQTTATASNLHAGNYTVIVSDSASCAKSISESIINIPGGTANFTFINACEKMPVSFINTSSSNTILWKWDFGDGTSSGLKDPSNAYNSPGTYPVKLVVSDTVGCVDSIIETVTIYPAPVVDFGDSIAGCSPLMVSFTNNSSPSAGSNYLWNFGDNTTSTIQSPKHNYTNGTQLPLSYNISLKVTSGNGCVSNLTKNNLVVVYPVTTALFTADPGITDIMTPTVNFHNQSIGNKINIWTFGDGDSSFVINPIHTYKSTGIYTVCLTTDNAYGCLDKICNTVIINPTWSFFIPNAFTPNGDLVNDKFRGYGENILEYKLMIFDRWGNEIFETNDISDAWDGRANNGVKIAQQDVYVYEVILRDVFKMQHRYTGTVTLIK